MIRQRLSALELFCFGLAAIMTIGWSIALIVDWGLNIAQLPRILAIIAVLVGVGLLRRKKRLSSRIGMYR